MPRLIGLLVLILVVLALLDVWRSNKDMEKKVLWTVAIVLVPFLGAIGYFVVGRR